MVDADKNFDALFDRFQARIYQTAKGRIRLQVLTEDLSQFTAASTPLDVWDAGCGFAQTSLWLAGAGHRITACDVSTKMLAAAREAFAANDLTADFRQVAFQDMARQMQQVDLVLFHAVIEWLEDPLQGLSVAADRVRPGGYLSLLFYNLNSMVYKNVLRGQWRLKPILEDQYLGKGNRLSPPNPQYPHIMREWLLDRGFSIERHSGIRVFHDYLNGTVLNESDPELLIRLEQKYCRMPTYRDMGRYVHLLAKRT